MSYTQTALTRIIEHSFDGKKSNLAKACHVAPRVITMLTTGQKFTAKTLDTVCRSLCTEDAKILCIAAARDLVPPEYAQDLTLDTPPTTTIDDRLTYNAADPEAELILHKLRILVSHDPEAREWLRLTGKWIFPELDTE